MKLSAEQMRFLAERGLSLDDVIAFAECGSDFIVRVIDDLRDAGCPNDAIAIVVAVLAKREVGKNNSRNEADAERSARYRSRRTISDSEWQELRREAIDRDGYVCRYCCATIDTAHCDHIIPLSRGGTNDLDNLAVACLQCNSSKRDRLLSEWQPPLDGWA